MKSAYTKLVCKKREFPSIEEILKDGCPHFKDKSLFVELPCKVGDKVYMMSRGKIIPMIVNAISFNGNCEYMLNCSYADEETHGYSLLTFTEKTKGYYWELTREEAERKLKEV